MRSSVLPLPVPSQIDIPSPGETAAEDSIASVSCAAELSPADDANRLARIAARLLCAPAAFAGVVESERYLLQSGVGLPTGWIAPRELPLGFGFAPDVLSSAAPLLLGDARRCSRYGDNPLITEYGFVAYAGVPLHDSTGEVVGTLGVLDTRPRRWSPENLETLTDLAALWQADPGRGTTSARSRKVPEATEQQLLYDPLTGLPNRLLFTERLSHSIQRAKRRKGYQCAVLFLDLNRFKVVNDSLGHQVGDELLTQVATRLQECLRMEDTIARLGGDEFAVLLEDVDDLAGAIRVAERIQRTMQAPVEVNGYELFTSASIGIAMSSPTYNCPEHLLRNADMAMYRAKASGRECYQVFDRAMHAEALARLELETDLRQALERKEFHLAYQPVICLPTGRITGFEALLRWEHPTRGAVPPMDFIPVAEETGLILPLGRWVLGEACRQLSVWRAAFPAFPTLCMSVNLSVKQFCQPDLVDQVREALEENGLDPQHLKLEITESVIVENSAAATDMLHELKALGVQVYMDDFGTGYSSLGYLHRLPLDVLKIDRSFISRMESDNRRFQLVRTILTLAQSVGMATVAEGVTAEAQLRELRHLGCECAQGYLFARPLGAEGAGRLLADNPIW